MDALGYIHGREIVHRDVKPLNVFINSSGEMKLGDFGLALSTRRNDATTQVRLVKL
jgi:serine/threonine protein kinase